MKVDEVTITLPSDQYAGREHSFALQERDGKLIVMVAGRVVATLVVETMTKKVKDEDGDYHTKPSDNFFIRFNPRDPVDKGTATAWAEPASLELIIAAGNQPEWNG